MELLQAMTGQPGYLKAGFFGFTKAGKTWTAMLLAVGTRKFFEHDGPIAMFDTEGGSDYIGKRVKEQTGKDLLVLKGRSFDQLRDVGKECISSGVSVLVVDSITHVWRELMEAYCEKRRINSSLMPISAIMEIKKLWAPWPDFYLTSPLHIIVCGRGGHEWEMREDEESGREVLTKTGTKMKVETEFGFEASLLVEMERINEQATGISRRATIIGDRFGVIDGRSQENPTFEFFLPHLELLKPNGHIPVDVTSRSDPDVDESGSGWSREKKQRVIFAEEIQGELVRKFPSMSASDKAAKSSLVWGIFGTRSWTAVENLRSDILKQGLSVLREFLADELSMEDFFAQPEPDPSCLTTLYRSRQPGPETESKHVALHQPAA